MSDFDESSNSSRPPKSPQSDDLRTRIANALADGIANDGGIILRRYGAGNEVQLSVDTTSLADAVIRELGGLRHEDSPDIAGESWGIHRRIVSDSTFIPGVRYDR